MSYRADRCLLISGLFLIPFFTGTLRLRPRSAQRRFEHGMPRGGGRSSTALSSMSRPPAPRRQPRRHRSSRPRGPRRPTVQGLLHQFRPSPLDPPAVYHPITRRAACSPWRPCVWGADSCLRSDGMTNPRPQAVPLRSLATPDTIGTQAISGRSCGTQRGRPRGSRPPTAPRGSTPASGSRWTARPRPACSTPPRSAPRPRCKGVDILWGHFSRVSQPCAIPPALCVVLYLVAMRMEC